MSEPIEYDHARGPAGMWRMDGGRWLGADEARWHQVEHDGMRRTFNVHEAAKKAHGSMSVYAFRRWAATMYALLDAQAAAANAVALHADVVTSEAP